ncbi:MAG: DUF4230 domain-containing protein [Elusimicrobia bacterium]|nr:DUF4230 domain-containing protein [Elusimicrobiota bacterium]
MKPWKLYSALALLLAAFGGGLWSGWRLFRPARPQTQVTAQLILTALKDQGFLVTKTYVFDAPVTIRKLSGSAFKDFFMGQTITARGVMEVNLGIDLLRISERDVTVAGDEVAVVIPPASLFNVRLAGPLDLKNEQGILKRLLQNEDGYNEALAQLSSRAEAAARDPELLKRAGEAGREQLSRLLKFVAPGRSISVRGAGG